MKSSGIQLRYVTTDKKSIDNKKYTKFKKKIFFNTDFD